MGRRGRLAPRGTRSLLRRPRTGPWGRRVTPHGPWRTYVRLQTLRPRLRARLRAQRCGKRQLAGARFGRCDLAARTKVLAVCGIGAAVLWAGAAPAIADSMPLPTKMTTSVDPHPAPIQTPVTSVQLNS